MTIAVVLCVHNIYHHADAGDGDVAKYYRKAMIIKRFNDVYDNIGRMICSQTININMICLVFTLVSTFSNILYLL